MKCNKCGQDVPKERMNIKEGCCDICLDIVETPYNDPDFESELSGVGQNAYD